MIVKLLTEHHLVFLSLKGGCTGSSESTHVKCHIVGNLMHWLIFSVIFYLLQRSRHSSGTSTGSTRTKRADSSDQKKRPTLASTSKTCVSVESLNPPDEELWHLQLRAALIDQYIKYLESIGFHYVQMRPHSVTRRYCIMPTSQRKSCSIFIPYTVNVLKFGTPLSFFSQMKCWLSRLEFTKCMSEKQTGKTLIRLLLQKQSDLGMYCLSRPF